MDGQRQRPLNDPTGIRVVEVFGFRIEIEAIDLLDRSLVDASERVVFKGKPFVIFEIQIFQDRLEIRLLHYLILKHTFTVSRQTVDQIYSIIDCRTTVAQSRPSK